MNQVLTNTTTTTQIVEYVISMDTNEEVVQALKLSDIKSSLVHKLQAPANQVEICSTDNFNYTVESNMGDSVSYSGVEMLLLEFKIMPVLEAQNI